MPKVAIIMGSKSDLAAVEPAIALLRAFSVETDVRVMSAHRTPYEVQRFASAAKDDGYEVIIAAAGKAAHLPGVIAAYTVLPVIGIPIKSSFMDGLDSLLSIVQMPSGIPVATVGTNASENAALLAVQIMAGKTPALWDRLAEYRAAAADKVIEADKSLKEAE